MRRAGFEHTAWLSRGQKEAANEWQQRKPCITVLEDVPSCRDPWNKHWRRPRGRLPPADRAVKMTPTRLPTPLIFSIPLYNPLLNVSTFSELLFHLPSLI